MARAAGLTFNTGINSPDNFLMTFDGCNPALGCTILLSGPPSEREELLKLRKAVRTMLELARTIFLERFYINML